MEKYMIQPEFATFKEKNSTCCKAKSHDKCCFYAIIRSFFFLKIYTYIYVPIFKF